MSESRLGPAEEQAYRLPRTVVPERYAIRLAPDLTAATFEGEETVEVRVHEVVEEILINAVELEIASAELVNDQGERIAGTVTLLPETERARIALARPAAPGAWRLHLRFSGILNDKLHGFYRSTFRDEAGNERVIATTQFEATDARRAFPGWDEPDLKAVFAVTLVVAADLMAVSNGPVRSETRLGDGRKAVEFADTIPMSTYLVAFVVGPLEATDPVDADGTPLRIVAVPGKGHLTEYALEVGAFALRFFAGYYGIPYPGTKLDLLALPDFAAGAMENLGAVTFREQYLLVDPAIATRSDLERVADVIAHEIAHMWFGDLVTMRWWNGLWLNEAFATFMELLAVDAFRPAWQRWISFGLDREAALQVDGLASTRPIEFPVHAPEDAEGMFDILTYQKGGAVLRMLEQYLGGEDFRRGIAQYLERHRFGNAETTDLWDAIEAATGEPVRRIMDSWIFQGGYPVVTVEPADGSGLRLTQARFRYRAAPEGADGARWQVPVLLRAGVEGDVETRRVLLAEAAATVDLPADAAWVVANESGHGFYRVRYAPELLHRLTANLQTGLSAIERFNLFGDTWAAVIAGLTPVREFLALARLIGDETDRNVWVSVIGALSYLRGMLAPADRGRAERFARDLIAPAAARLGWERADGESDLVSQLRGTLIAALGNLGEDPATRARARELHAAFVRDRAAIDRDVVPAVIAIVADSGGPADYDLFLERYDNSPTPQEKQRYLYSLAGFRDRALLQRTLDLCLTDRIRSQDAPFVIASVLGNLDGGDLAWRFIRDRWETIVERFPDNTHVRMLAGITALSTRDLTEEVEAFFQTHTVKQGAKTLEQHLEWLRINLAFREREAAALPAAFA